MKAGEIETKLYTLFFLTLKGISYWIKFLKVMMHSTSLEIFEWMLDVYLSQKLWGW